STYYQTFLPIAHGHPIHLYVEYEFFPETLHVLLLILLTVHMLFQALTLHLYVILFPLLFLAIHLIVLWACSISSLMTSIFLSLHLQNSRLLLTCRAVFLYQ